MCVCGGGFCSPTSQKKVGGEKKKLVITITQIMRGYVGEVFEEWL